MGLDFSDFFNNFENIFGFIFLLKKTKFSYILDSSFIFEKQGSLTLSVNIRWFYI